MAFGGTSSAQMVTQAQKPPADPNAKQKAHNQQQQRQYAADNGMAQAESFQGQSPNVMAAAANSPVSPTGQLQPSAPAPGYQINPPAAGRRPVNPAQAAGTLGIPTDPAGQQAFFAKLAPGMAVDGQAGMTWGHDPQTGWYISSGGQAPAGPGGGAPAGPPMSPYGPYPGMPAGAQSPAPYVAGTLSQWQAPDQSAPQSQIINALQAALGSGGSMGPDVVAKLKEVQKDSATSFRDQLGSSLDDRMASRGLVGGGQQTGGQRALDESMMQDILGAYRDIDIEAAQTNWQDTLDAAGALDDALGTQFSRASDSYSNTLKGQVGNETLKQAQFNLGLAGAENERANWAQELDAFFSDRGLDLDNRKLDITEKLGLGGLDLDSRRLDQDQSQFDQDYKLRLAALLSGDDQWRAGTGLGYAQLNGSLMNNFINAILK